MDGLLLLIVVAAIVCAPAGAAQKCLGCDHEQTHHDKGIRAGKAGKVQKCAYCGRVTKVREVKVEGEGAGTYGGYRVEKRLKEKSEYRVSLRLDDGQARQFSYAEKPAFQAGDRVRIENGALIRSAR